MAQEAKSPPAGLATGDAGDNPLDIKGTSAGDIGEGSYTAPEQGTERKLSLAERPRVVVVNKADRLPETERNRLARELGAVVVSAQDPGSLPPLRQAIADALDRARPVTSWASPSG